MDIAHNDAPVTSGAVVRPANETVPTLQRQSWDVQAPNVNPSPESNENPALPVGDMFPPDPFRQSADLRGYRQAFRGFVAYFFNPAQFWSSDQFIAGHIQTGRKPVQQLGGMAPFAERANIPDAQAGSYGGLVTAATYNLGLDPNSGW